MHQKFFFRVVPSPAILISLLLQLSALAILVPAGLAAPALAEGVFAIVNGQQISVDEYRSFLSQYARSKFYHGVKQEDLVALRKEAAEELINRTLLGHEAERRGIEPDTEAVERALAGFESRYKQSETWPEIRKQWPRLREELLAQSRLAALEKVVRTVQDPGDPALKVFYEQNRDLFTEPEKYRLSVILVGVDPGADASVWQAAKEKSDGIRAELMAGGGFGALAERHSTHESAKSGGDLGLVHSGTLSKPAQDAVEKLAVGETTPSVRVLEGYALFRLQDRHPPQLHDFGAVRERAFALYQRETSEKQWLRFVAALREQATVVVSGTPDLERPQ